MSGHLLTLVFLLVGAVSAQCTAHYYITPSPDIPCPEDPCLTLSQFAANSSNHFGNISLILLPGNHTLNREFILSGAHTFSMESQDNEIVKIECQSQSGKFIVDETTFASIQGLHFIGCGGNAFTKLEELVVEDTIFEGVEGEGRGTALVLTEVNYTKIRECSFISNTPGVNSERHRVGEFITDSVTLSLFKLREDDLVSVGGALFTTSSNVSVINTNFFRNEAEIGGALLAYKSIITICHCTHNYNRVLYSGGVMATVESLVDIDNSAFTKNVASREFFSIGGVIATIGGSFDITSSTFTNSSAAYGGGVLATIGGSFNITCSIFTNNSVTNLGGVMLTFYGSLNITSSSFTTNKANVGGVIWSEDLQSFTINNSSFNINTADNYGGIMFCRRCSTHITDSTFHYNSGSLYIFNGKLTFSGQSKFENCVEPSNKTSLTLQEGGALTSFQSTVTFNGETSFLSNQANQGGAILATESTIMLYGTTTIANNTATDSGGGASLEQSDVDVKGSCFISNNSAMRGGGVHARSSTITVHQSEGTLQFTNNRAENGGGLYLELNPKLYLLKKFQFRSGSKNFLTFIGNHANYGGAIYVADDTNTGACAPNIECFIQTLAHYQIIYSDSSIINIVNVQFSGNTATEHGSNLFGGLLDRCVPSPFAEVYQKQPSLRTQHYTGVSYLQDLSDIELDSISSPPVRVCFCDSESEPDCSYQPPPIKVKKGETFKVLLVAVDQVNHSVEANIISYLAHGGGFSEGQQTQSVGRNCTDLTFNVFSQRDNESINVFADGPCGSSQHSIRKLDIQFLDCTCPVGFQPNNESLTRCECICDFPYITKCNFTTSSIIRENTNSWITYINDTDPPGYVIHPNCPFDYCQPQTDNVSINLNLPNGADAQCAFNRTGTLCGACQEHLSLSLGSSRCLPCPSHWPAVLVVILLAAIIAGISLITALLALNMTVAVGLINGFIFYANIMSANSAVFFPSSEPSFPTVFVAWLNLDLGIDVCFIDGLDTYIKTWLQLAFPVYIISLVVIIIIVSEYLPKFAVLIGRKDPIATLATLILLSYSKLLSITITALSSADIIFPDGSKETVWLPDGNVKYFRGKHVVLVIVALLIILVGVPYTILLLFWQWIVHAPRWKVFKWTRNTKLNAFIAAYHVPYYSKYRYWTGLLLLVRVILYITASVTVSANPEVSLLATVILVGGLFLLKSIINLKVYTKSITDIIEAIIYFNLLTLAAFSMYDFKNDLKKQTAVAYTSTIITLLLLVGVIAYHVYLLIRKEKIPVELNEYPLAPVKPATAQVTHSVVEVHKPQCPPPEDDSDEVGDIQVREIVVTDQTYQ